ncbi:hypothetical protein NDU88_005206 [Pleurodeles waltl]|uniref:Secreted protein n=1 Tax=Pleurodeles waltl TaxID=8319 RepID=A0AAV7SL02_PLEWA|nr:hypothetical protein NDU88_005206 [Pleurodeles waltl]
MLDSGDADVSSSVVRTTPLAFLAVFLAGLPSDLSRLLLVLAVNSFRLRSLTTAEKGVLVPGIRAGNTCRLQVSTGLRCADALSPSATGADASSWG